MERIVLFLCLLTTSIAWTQKEGDTYNYSDYVMPEILYGTTAEPNDSFPPMKNQKGFILSFGNYHVDKDQEWVYRLNYPRTGVSFSVNDYGNNDQVGQSFSALSYLELDLFRKKKKDLKLNVALGASYFNKRLTREGNEVNKGVSTGLNWSFKVFTYYELFKSKKTTARIGVGYFHHSNGHTRLPNQGFNSFLLSASVQIHNKNVREYVPPDSIRYKKHLKTRQTYYSFRTGIGQQVLSEDFNQLKEVYSATVSMGQIVNKTYKFGGGIYYRFYEHYHDYIVAEGEIVTDLYPYFTEAPVSYASNIGLFGSAEVLLNHIAIEINLGFNIHKPFYKVDYQLNQGVSYYLITPDGPLYIEVLGELDQKYEFKRAISSRLGLKYYFIGNDRAPKHNIFIAATLNANLGQADFTEFSLGYVHGFDLKTKK